MLPIRFDNILMLKRILMLNSWNSMQLKMIYSQFLANCVLGCAADDIAVHTLPPA